MPLPEYLTLENGYALLAPAGQTTLEQGTAKVGDAIEYCREHGIRKMLIDITNVGGLASPSIVHRFWFVRMWAEKARGQVAIAMVAPAEFIDARKFAVTAAYNLGLRTDVFTTRQEALVWLLEEQGG